MAVVVDQSLSHIQLLWPHGLELSKFLCPWNFPGKNTGVGCHFLLPGIFLTQGSNPRYLPCRRSSVLQADVSLLSHQRIPFIWLQSPEQHLTYPCEIPFWDCHLHFSLNFANTNLTIFPVNRSGLLALICEVQDFKLWPSLLLLHLIKKKMAFSGSFPHRSSCNGP